MSWTNLKNSIAAVVRTNNNQEITGANLQSVLYTIVNSLGANATFAGIAVPSTNPGTPDGPTFYIAGAGTFPNFGSPITIPVGSLGIFWFDGSQWNDTVFTIATDYGPTIAAIKAQIGYYTCSVGSNELTVNADGYTIPDSGGVIRIKMSAAAVSDSAHTLAIGSTTAKTLWYNGAAVSTINTWDAGEVISVYYNNVNNRYEASNAQGGGGRAEKISYNNNSSNFNSENVQAVLDEISEEIFVNNERQLSPAMSTGSVWNWTSARHAYTGNVSGYVRVTSAINISSYDYVKLKFYMTSDQSPHCFFTDDSGNMKGSKLYNTTGDYVRFNIPAGATKLYFSSNTGNQASYGIIAGTIVPVNELVSSIVSELDEINLMNLAGLSSLNDLEITDEADNVLAIFYNGHIRTKNFDSSNLKNTTERFSGKHICIIGDSVSTYAGYIPSGWKTHYNSSNLASVSLTYWYKLCSTLGMTFNNCSYSTSRASGNSQQQASDITGADGQCPGCSDARIEALSRDGKTPDIVLIYLGINDWAGNVQIGTFCNDGALPAEGVINYFSDAYALMINKIRTQFPTVRIFCCTVFPNLARETVPPFRGGSSPYTNGNSLYSYNKAIKDVAKIMGCDIIDLAACGINNISASTTTHDNKVHPNATGFELMYKKILSEIISKY